MITTVTSKNMITIPSELTKAYGIKPGYKLDWQPVSGKEEIRVRIIPERSVLSKRLMGTGKKFSPERDSVKDLITERESEG